MQSSTPLLEHSSHAANVDTQDAHIVFSRLDSKHGNGLLAWLDFEEPRTHSREEQLAARGSASGGKDKRFKLTETASRIDYGLPFYCHPEVWNNSKAFPAGHPRGGLRKDFAVTRADDTSVRSHPQLFNGRRRSTTASCGTTASSRRAPPEVVVTAYPAWPACCCFSVVSIKRTRRGHPCDQNHKLFPWAAHEHWTQLHCVALFTACLTFMFHKPPLG